MRLPRRLALLAACGVCLAGCSRSYSTLESGSQAGQRIYVLTPEEADAVAHNAIVTSFPGRRVLEDNPDLARRVERDRDFRRQFGRSPRDAEVGVE